LDLEYHMTIVPLQILFQEFMQLKLFWLHPMVHQQAFKHKFIKIIVYIIGLITEKKLVNCMRNFF